MAITSKCLPPNCQPPKFRLPIVTISCRQH
jgi:hypothetical protein